MEKWRRAQKLWAMAGGARQPPSWPPLHARGEADGRERGAARRSACERTNHSDGNSTRSANSVPLAGATLILPMLMPDLTALRSNACASGRESTLSPEM